jgi:hypothetical protein
VSDVRGLTDSIDKPSFLIQSAFGLFEFFYLEETMSDSVLVALIAAFSRIIAALLGRNDKPKPIYTPGKRKKRRK